jgi:hypothetical protein
MEGKTVSVHERVRQLHALSDEDLLSLPKRDEGRIVQLGNRVVREFVWLDPIGGDARVIVQQHDSKANRLWVGGFVITADGTRRPLGDKELREYT